MAVVALLAGRQTARPLLPRFQQLTFRHGSVGYAQFAPDGQTIVYSASWDGSWPDEIFTTRPDSLESRPLGIRGVILSVSSAGEMAVCLLPGRILAQAPLAGDAPRQLVNGVQWAEWAPDGKSLAIIRRVEGKFRLEHPIGKVLYETSNRIDNLHVSPAGTRIAFREVSGQFIHIRGEVAILETASGKRTSTGIASTEFGWAPDGKELWYLRESNELRGVAPGTGRERVVARFPGFFQLDDIARDGRLLLERIDVRSEVRGIAPGDKTERSLSWLDSSFAADLSADGKTVLINEGAHDAVYLRRTDGSPAVPLGEGKALALSPDGEWAMALRAGPPQQLVLLPVHAGETKELKTGLEGLTGGSFLPHGKRVLFCGTERGHKPRLYMMDIEEGKARAVSPEGVELGQLAVRWISPDGKLVFARSLGQEWLLYPLDGRDSSPLPIAGLAADDAPVGWTADSRSLFVQGAAENPAPVFRLDWRTGKRELFREFRPSDPTGIAASIVLVSPDAKAWVYSYVRRLSELYLVEGLH